MHRNSQHRLQQFISRQHIAAAAQQQHRDVIQGWHQPEQTGIGWLRQLHGPAGPPGCGVLLLDPMARDRIINWSPTSR